MQQSAVHKPWSPDCSHAKETTPSGAFCKLCEGVFCIPSSTVRRPPTSPLNFLARAHLQGLRHPNIVRAHDWFELDGKTYFAMEQVEGASSIIDYLRPHQGRFDEHVAAVFGQLIDGLDYVHSTNIVHYGLSPSHILLDADGVIKIIDFGLARRLGMDESEYWPPGTFTGIPAYMSPEHLQGHICIESDYFTVGTLLVEHLLGRNPFCLGDAIPGILAAIASVDSEAMLSGLSDIPDSLSEIVGSLLHRQAERRRNGWALFRALAKNANRKGKAIVSTGESRQQFLDQSQANLGMLPTLVDESGITPRNRQIEDLFIKAISLDLRDRVSFLERECAGDQELLNEVAALLAASEQASEHSQLPPLVPGEWSKGENLLEPGVMVGKYRVVGKVGEGGMGEVYAVHNDELNRPAAIKLLRSELSQSDQSARRFLNEARAAASIRHPGIVDIIDVARLDNGRLYILMELLDGESLSKRLKRAGVLPEATAIALLRQAADALAAAHERGVVHRDLKPANLFLVPDSIVPGGNRLKLLDFGIAKLMEDGTLTRSGAVMGTPPYMSPEQCRDAKSADHRSDLYSLGIILFEMLCGHPPFIRESTFDYLMAHVSEEPPSVKEHNPLVSDSVAAITARLLAKNPSDRYSSTRALIAALDQAVSGTPGLQITRVTSGSLGWRATAVADTLPASSVSRSLKVRKKRALLDRRLLMELAFMLPRGLATEDIDTKAVSLIDTEAVSLIASGMAQYENLLVDGEYISSLLAQIDAYVEGKYRRMLQQKLVVLPLVQRDSNDKYDMMLEDSAETWKRDTNFALLATRYEQMKGWPIGEIDGSVKYICKSLSLALQYDAAIIPHPDRWPLFQYIFDNCLWADDKEGNVSSVTGIVELPLGFLRKRRADKWRGLFLTLSDLSELPHDILVTRYGPMQHPFPSGLLRCYERKDLVDCQLSEYEFLRIGAE